MQLGLVGLGKMGFNMRERLRDCRVPYAVVRSLREAQAFCRGWGLTRAAARAAI